MKKIEYIKILWFFLLFAYLIGAVSGASYLFYYKEWFVAICSLIVSVMAFPTVKHLFGKLIA